MRRCHPKIINTGKFMKPEKEKIVIKYGGHAMEDMELNRIFCRDLAELADDRDFIVVHGGGPQIAENLRRLDIPSRFREGLRVTDDATLEVVEAALCGTVNKKVVRDLLREGLSALGISGIDGAFIRADIICPELGRVGEVRKVDAALPLKLLRAGFLPVIAPLGIDENFQPLNINADTAAGAIAGALRADYFVLVSDVPGVLDGKGQLLPKLSWAEIEDLRGRGVISGGMIPKVLACHHALKNGCEKALILDGRKQGSLKKFLENGEPLGTVIVAS